MYFDRQDSPVPNFTMNNSRTGHPNAVVVHIAGRETADLAIPFFPPKSPISVLHRLYPPAILTNAAAICTHTSDPRQLPQLGSSGVEWGGKGVDECCTEDRRGQRYEEMVMRSVLREVRCLYALDFRKGYILTSFSDRWLRDDDGKAILLTIVALD